MKGTMWFSSAVTGAAMGGMGGFGGVAGKDLETSNWINSTTGSPVEEKSSPN